MGAHTGAALLKHIKIQTTNTSFDPATPFLVIFPTQTLEQELKVWNQGLYFSIVYNNKQLQPQPTTKSAYD